MMWAQAYTTPFATGCPWATVRPMSKRKKLSTRVVIAFWAVVLILWAIGLAFIPTALTPSMSFSEFVDQVERGEVTEVRIRGSELRVQTAEGRYRVVGALDDELTRFLSEDGVPIEESTWGSDSLLFLLAVIVLVLLIFWWFYRSRVSASGGPLNAIRKTRAKIIPKGSVQTRFSDVGGLDEVKEDLRDLISFMSDPEPWEKAGANLPRGVLLQGPPGCGKTLLARAVAGESGVGFMAVAGSEFIEIFVGSGSARIRDTFEAAREAAPCILFIDEIDAIGRRRSAGSGLSNDEREHTLNQLLVELDGFTNTGGVLVLAATNRADVLDAALLRAGRFDMRVDIAAPDPDARAEILAVHLRGKPLSEDIDVDEIIELTEGRTGADLEQIANRAAMAAVRRAVRASTEPLITQQDLLASIEDPDEESPGRSPLDSLLIDSGNQFLAPTRISTVKITMLDGQHHQGELIWADPNHIRLDTEQGPVVLSRKQLRSVVTP